MGKYVATAVLILAAGIVVFKKDPDLLVGTISQGGRVDIADHLISGQRTVIEFTAEW